MNWMSILFIILAALVAWFGLKMIRNNPNFFSKENMENSFRTVGILTLLLIIFIGLLVLLLRG